MSAGFRSPSLSLLLLSVLFAALTACRPSSTPEYSIHERRDTTSIRWVKRDRLDPASLLPVKIALSHANTDTAHQHLLAISDPSSPSYGQHWTADQVKAHFQPAQDAYHQVRQWLSDAGIHPHRITLSDNKGWLVFDATAAKAETLLRTTLHEFHDRNTGVVQPGCDHYSLPLAVRDHIDFVTPGIKLTSAGARRNVKAHQRRDISPKALASRPASPPTHDPDDLSTCDITITPACIRALYRVPPPSPGPKIKDNSMGIFETQLQFYTQEDLNLFFSNLSKQIPADTHPINVEIDGGQAATTNLSQAGEEANMDIMLAYPLVYPQTITLYQVDDLHYQGMVGDTSYWGYNTFLDALDASYCNSSAYGETGDASIDPHYPDPSSPGGFAGQRQCGGIKPTSVISFSYLGWEVDVPVSYQRRQCDEFLKLGLQGVSILFASGDAGVADYPAPYGLDGETGCLGPKKNVFNPTWPNTCPWVTAVGATKVYPGRTVHDPESAVFDPAGHPYHVDYSSGGGFSNIFAIPDYQKQAVAAYFKDHKPPYTSYANLTNSTGDLHPDIDRFAARGGVYNRLGRGVPDVAANGDNTAIYSGGKCRQYGGTSAATPIFASIINRINEERLAKGKKTLGFLNPSLYKMPSVLNDIVNGTNPGCGTRGFSAVKGWDPVTGLGTPDYPRMLDYYMSLP